jgi:alkylated DNA repair dioxygenase AlkB
MATAPLTYVPGFVALPDAAFDILRENLAWERRGATPRREYYCNDAGVPYSYGKAEYAREYLPQAWHPVLRMLQTKVQALTNTAFEVCFLNGYENSRDQLGWHADNSISMDDKRPIAILSLGAEREIWFRPTGSRNLDEVEKLKLRHGSLCLMAAGMQDTHEHRIPKAGFECGPRISLTFRGYSPVAADS